MPSLTLVHAPPLVIKKGIMICKECNKAITKENVKKTIGCWKYTSICRLCHNKDVKLRYEKKKKAIEESRWF